MMSGVPYAVGTPEKSSRFKGPCRVVRFCLLGILAPVALLAIPLYMRFVLYEDSHYPLTATDMRMIDGKMSTTWCQSQLIRMNGSFHAHVVDTEPSHTLETTSTVMDRVLVIEDDTKEYWGFFLIKGSTFSLSTCARWEGANMLVVQGRSHLRYCTYVGDMDSMNEESEADRSDRVGGGAADTSTNRKRQKFMAQGVKETVPTEAPPASAPPPDNTTAESSKEMMDSIIQRILQMNEKGGNVFAKIRKRLRDEETEKQNVEVKLYGSSTARGNIEHNLNVTQPMRESSTASYNAATESPTTKRANHHIRHERHRERERSQRQRRSATSKKTSDVWEAASEEDHASEDLEADDLVDPQEIPPLPSVETDWMAADHGRLNLSTDGDNSNSEEGSSWSSSEEAMLKCKGVIIHVPINPDHRCPHSAEAERVTFSYQVPETGYYYIIFDSDNEITDNVVHVRFELRRTVYDLQNVKASCYNTTECSLPLSFASYDKVIVQVPDATGRNDLAWNENYDIISTCEPRMSLYLIFALSVPVMILACAFH